MQDDEHMEDGQDQTQPYSDSPAVPPTQAGPLARPALGYAARPAPVWPTVIGVIGIVVGGLGFLASAWSAVAPMVMSSLFKNGPAASGMPQFGDAWIRWSIASGVIGCVLAVALTVAGIGILRHSAWGPKVVRIWAVLKIVMGVVSVAAGYQMQTAVMSSVQQNTSPAGAPPMNMGVFLLGGMCIGLAWVWALPIFMLIWFARSSVKQEIARWPEADTQTTGMG